MGMALKQDGSLWAAGYNGWGNLGTGTTAEKVTTFVKVISSGVKAVSVGTDNTVVLKKDGSVWGAGNNQYGQIGDGQKKNMQKTFVKVVDGGRVKEVSGGKWTTVLLTDKNELCVAGYNANGELGTGTTKAVTAAILNTCYPRPGGSGGGRVRRFRSLKNNN